MSDEVTKRLSSTNGDYNAAPVSVNPTNDHEISDVPVTGSPAGADHITEVPVVGIPADDPVQSVVQVAVSQFQEELSVDFPTITSYLPSTLFYLTEFTC